MLKTTADPARKRELERDIAELDTPDEILLASRLDASPSNAVTEPVELLAVTAEECARYDGAIVEGEPVIVPATRGYWRNRLENSRRHGETLIEVRLHGIGPLAELRVCDRGPGVPEAEREAIFQPFHRFGRASEHGAGLGLADARVTVSLRWNRPALTA